MSRNAGVVGTRCEGSGPVLALAQRKTSPAPGRIAAAHLMAPPSHAGLPSLEGVTTEQCFLADDAEAVGLAELLVTSKIAVVQDWEKSGRDPTKYLLLTLQRWIGTTVGAQSTAGLIWMSRSATGSSTTRRSARLEARYIS